MPGTSKNISPLKGLQCAFIFILSCIHFVVFLLMCLTGYCNNISPNEHPWLVSATLCFGPIATAYVIIAIIWLCIKRKYFVTSLFGLLTCAIPLRTYFPLNFFRTEPSENSIKVLSYNVKGYFVGNNPKYWEILNYIHHCKADILCLQEAENTNSDKLSFDSIMKPWAYKDTVKLNYNTLALYSKFPIIDKCIIKASDKEHGAVIYRIEKGDDTIAVVNCHLISNLISDSDKSIFKKTIKKPVNDSTKVNVHYLARKIDEAGILRIKQAESIIHHIKKLGNMPIILCGDFNDSPLSYVHAMMTKELNDTYTRSGLGAGISFHEAGMYFRIDHILCSSHWNCEKSVVDNTCNGSDHYPIYSWLKLE